MRLLGHEYHLVDTVLCPDEAATLAFGQALATRLQPGDTVALTGDLGAGKTTLVRGLASGYGIDEGVHSPSYALMHTYTGNVALHHLDLYRLPPETDFQELGLDDLKNGLAIALIEWPERLPEGWEFKYWVHLEIRTENEENQDLWQDSPRRITLRTIR
jgi:tRNA threonylcarbamoyladenosine biosynthesis protein TsaE